MNGVVLFYHGGVKKWRIWTERTLFLTGLVIDGVSVIPIWN